MVTVSKEDNDSDDDADCFIEQALRVTAGNWRTALLLISVSHLSKVLQ